MAATELMGRITDSGALEVNLPGGLKPGPVRITIASIDPDQAWFWSPEWQAQESKVDQEIEAGHYKDFSTMEEFIDDLTNDDDE
jgi:hypothetical protein